MIASQQELEVCGVSASLEEGEEAATASRPLEEISVVSFSTLVSGGAVLLLGACWRGSL